MMKMPPPRRRPAKRPAKPTAPAAAKPTRMAPRLSNLKRMAQSMKGGMGY